MKRSECPHASPTYDRAHGWNVGGAFPSNIPMYPLGQNTITSGAETRPPTAYGIACRGPRRMTTRTVRASPTKPFVRRVAVA